MTVIVSGLPAASQRPHAALEQDIDTLDDVARQLWAYEVSGITVITGILHGVCDWVSLITQP